MAITLNINGKDVAVQALAGDAAAVGAARRARRDRTKYGCGIAQCGAAHRAPGRPRRWSPGYPVGGLAGVKIATIEGLYGHHPLQEAWVERDVPQCGYCLVRARS